jgi:RNA polymerase sigma-70 factor, ECF subfamily
LLAALPDDQAEAVMLRVVNDLPTADVASVMGTSVGNVRVLVHRGLTRLRRKLSVTDEVFVSMKRVP